MGSRELGKRESSGCLEGGEYTLAYFVQEPDRLVLLNPKGRDGVAKDADAVGGGQGIKGLPCHTEIQAFACAGTGSL